MRSKSPLRKLLVVVAVSLCAAALGCEFVLAHAESAALQSHQERWDCLARESSKAPSCIALAKLAPSEDADYCSQAVMACTANGLYAEASRAEERLVMWDGAARLFRLLVLCAAACSLLWFALVRPIRSVSRPAEGQ